MTTKDPSGLESLLKEGEERSEFDWNVDDIGGDDETFEVVRFTIGGLSVAAEGRHVREVVAAGKVTPIPRTPDHVRGITLLKREVLSILDLAVWFGFEGTINPEGSRMLVVQTESFTAGILADTVDGIESWPETLNTSSLPESMDARLRSFSLSSRWAPGGVVVLLDVQAILEATAVR